MKKGLIGVLFIILLTLFAALYVFIPGKTKISKLVVINANSRSTYRYLVEKELMKKWWPNGITGNNLGDKNNAIVYNNDTFRITQKYFNSVNFLIKHQDSFIVSTITILPLRIDSVAVQWDFNFTTSINPVERFLQYKRAKMVARNLTDILVAFQKFMNQKEDVYGIHVRSIKVKDTLLIATKSVTKNHPTVKEVYGLIDNLKKFIISHKANETNYPMLHVEAIDSNHFETMVAIPVDKVLKDSGNIFLKRMVPGNILVTEIKGGLNSIKTAFIQMENFKEDYQFISPAIPFESLVTNRLNETDTTKWITRIYYPIF